MPDYSALHVCLPGYDNLGDRLGMQAVAPLFSEHNLHLTVDVVNIQDLINQKIGLDPRIDEINRTYDMLIIGAGGYLHPLHLLPRIFHQIESWAKLKIPLILFGFGVVNLHENCPYPTKFALLSPHEDNHLTAALRAATAVSVRDVRSWFVSTRLLGTEAHKVFLTGCPTVFLTGRQKHVTPITHEIGLNLPFRHALCNQYQDVLLKIASLLVGSLTFSNAKDAEGQTKTIKWICHSEGEREDAEQLRSQLKQGFDIVTPKTFDETSAAFASCRFALVTKGHAGIFALANRVPFAFLSYDVKCDGLVESLWDDPQDLLLYIHKLRDVEIDQVLQTLLNNLIRLSPKLKIASDHLMDHFAKEFENFFDTIKARLHTSAR